MHKIFDNKLDLQHDKKIELIKTKKFTIILPKIFGFCGGVIGALKKLDALIEANKKNKHQAPKIFLLGEIIHNSTVNQIIASSGVEVIPEQKIETIFAIAKKDDYIVIPAFGIPLNLENRIRKKYKNIVDTTCKNVKSIWTFISKEAAKGSTIILHAKTEHPELKASISRAEKSNCIIILPNLNSAKHLAKLIKKNPTLNGVNENKLINNGIVIYNFNKFNPNRLALANQTTMLFSETKEIENLIKRSINTKACTLIVCNTLCDATYLRQQAAIKVRNQKPDTIIVVGGYDSSNTTNLYKLAKPFTDTYYIKDANAISRKKITHFIPESSKEIQTEVKDALEKTSKIVILAGASCPFTEINQIIKKLEKI